MKAIWPNCCDGFICAQCDYPLWRVPEPSEAPHSGVGIPEEITMRVAGETYATTFERGGRGGALVTLGENVIECFLPFIDESTGDLPFMPMPLGGEVIHD